MSKTETDLMDTSAFRRLHRIKQLAHAYTVYPSAHHTRFEHSLGVMHIAGRMYDEIGTDTDDKITVRLAGMLHDVGHGPFSHLFERILKKVNPGVEKIHEEIGQRLIKENESIDKILSDCQKTDIIKILSKDQSVQTSPLNLLSDIVSSNLDADKMDYLRRDSYFLGVSYGLFDLERVIHTLTRTPENGPPNLAIDVQGIDALESYRLGRYLMHAQVYNHHTRLAADQMFLRALDMAIYDEGVIESDRLNLSSSDFMDFYMGLDDEIICNLITKSRNAKVSRQILNDIRQRNLLKQACRFNNLREDPRIFRKTQDDLDKIARTVADELDVPTHEVIIYKAEPNVKLYDYGDILVVDNGRISSMDRYSAIATKNDNQLTTLYVFGPPDKALRVKIAEKIADEFGLSTDSAMYPKLK